MRINITNKLIGKAYVFIVLIISVLSSLNKNVSTNSSISIFYVNCNTTLILLSLSLIVFLYFICIKEVKVDIIMKLLLLRIGTIVISILLNSQKNLGNVLPYFISLIVYCIIRSSKLKIRDILPYMKIIVFILIMQAILLFIISPVPYGDLGYKYYFVAPIGASNTFAARLSIFTFIIFQFSENNISKSYWLLLSVVAILLSKSRTALLILILFLLYIEICKFLNNTRVKKQSLFLLMILILFTCVFLVIKSDYIINLITVFFGGFSGAYTGINKLDALLSGRLELWIEDLAGFIKRPVFGNAFNFRISPHNFITEILFVSGVSGFIVNAMLFFEIYKYYKINSSKNADSLKIFIIIIFILFNGMLEKTLFTILGDFILWLIVACLLNTSNLNE